MNAIGRFSEKQNNIKIHYHQKNNQSIRQKTPQHHKTQTRHFGKLNHPITIWQEELDSGRDVQKWHSSIPHPDCWRKQWLLSQQNVSGFGHTLQNHTKGEGFK